MARRVAVALGALAFFCALGTARAGLISGDVFWDDDGDGLFDLGEAPAADLAVYWNTSQRTVTDEQGAFSLEVPDQIGHVWVRTPDAAAPGPVYRRVSATGAEGVDLALTPIEPGPLRFAVISDLHTGWRTLPIDDIASALLGIDTRPQPLSFIVATGDLTQGGEPDMFKALADILLGLETPFVPVPGNHDWKDGGAAYHNAFGPATYSFDCGGLRFVVINDALSNGRLASFLALDLADAGDRQVVAFRHAPPPPELIPILEDGGIDTLFTGHFHANRVLRHADMVQYNTQPLAMAGIDTSPGGYRLVSLSDGGELTQVPVTVTDAAFDSAPEQAASAPLALDDWPQLQGGPERRGTAEVEITPPLEIAWATDVGETLHGGQVIVAGGVVLVSIADFGDGSRGGVVALDGATGAELWRARLGASVRNAPAVADGVVVVNALDGTVHGLDLATGEPLWSVSVAPMIGAQYRSLYASPLIVEDTVFAGNQREFVALDLQSGELLWSAIPHDAEGFYGSTSSPAAVAGLVVASFAGGSHGLMAFDAVTGDKVWNSAKDVTNNMLASPVIGDGVAYAITWTTVVQAVHLDDGESQWSRTIDSDSFDWAYGVVGTPALADDVLYVGTQHGGLHAIDLLSHIELWRAETEVGYLRAAHYRGRAAAVPASPVVTGALVWFAGNDGILRAHDVITGRAIWERDLGAPVTMAPAPAGDALIVATYDGVVRALVPAGEGAPGAADAAVDAGCGCSSSTGTGSWLAAAMVLLAIARRRATRTR